MKNYHNCLAGLIAMTMFAGCAYQASIDVAPAYNVYSSYEDTIPGDWVLVVDTENIGPEIVRFPGLSCSAYTYPLDVSGSLTESARRTIGNIVENVEIIYSPVSRDELDRSSRAGQIVLRGESVDADLTFHQGFWTNSVEAEVEIVLNIQVDGRVQRLLGTTVSGDAEAEAGAGAFCEGAADALSEAAAEAVRNTLRRAAEQISNGQRIRESIE